MLNRVTAGVAAAAGLWTGVLAVRVAAQTPDPPAIKASTGVYTSEQADRGKELFGSLCTSCHNTASQSGATFAKKWDGLPLSDLYFVMSEQMPKDDPGSLDPKQRADVIAYLLQLNELPAGKDELRADAEFLKKIVIDLSRHFSRPIPTR